MVRQSGHSLELWSRIGQRLDSDTIPGRPSASNMRGNAQNETPGGACERGGLQRCRRPLRPAAAGARAVADGGRSVRGDLLACSQSFRRRQTNPQAFREMLLSRLSTLCIAIALLLSCEARQTQQAPASGGSLPLQPQSLLSAYSQDPHSIVRAEVVLELSWFTDVVPPGSGSTSLRTFLDDNGMRSNLTVEVAVPKRSETTPFELDLAIGQDRIGAALAALNHGGWSDLSRPKAEEAGEANLSGRAYSLHINVQGKHGAGSFDGRLPYGRRNKQSERAAVAGFEEALRLLSAR